MARLFLPRGLLVAVLLVFPSPVAGPPAYALSPVSTIGVGIGPSSLAVDPVTNRVYVANLGSRSISVVDGATNRVDNTIPLVGDPGGVAVNPTTNRLDVAEGGGNGGTAVAVFDGASNGLIATIPVVGGPVGHPGGIAVDPASNRIFVTHDGATGGSSLSAIDGIQNAVVSTIGTGAVTRGGPVVDEQTHRVYVPDGSLTGGDILVFAGTTDTLLSSFSVGQGQPIAPPTGLAVNASTNRVYVPSDGLAVVDGATNSVVARIPVAGGGLLAAVNSVANQVAVASGSGGLLIVDGKTNSVLAQVSIGFNPSAIAFNSATNRLYLTNSSGNAVSVVDVGGLLSPMPTPHDARYFAQTGYRIDNDTIWDYFNRRGGVNLFGYPVSRTFTLQGFQVQFFQRRVVQLGPDGHARLLNLLDPGIMPYTSFNGAQTPSYDSSLVATAPSTADQAATLAWVKAHAPDSFQGLPVNFGQTFSTSVSFPVAFPNRGDAGLLPGFDLELWGIPTSSPQFDPDNHNFVYQRFQRGIMHYRTDCNCTQGILLADYLKDILTGQDLPGDLAAKAQGSPYLQQYDPSAPNWVHNPNLLPNTDLTNAFVAE